MILKKSFLPYLNGDFNLPSCNFKILQVLPAQVHCSTNKSEYQETTNSFFYKISTIVEYHTVLHLENNNISSS